MSIEGWMGVGGWLGGKWVLCDPLFPPYCIIWLCIAHQEAEGAAYTFQDLSDREKSDRYTTK